MKLSKSKKRHTEREAAEEFFRRKRRQPEQVRALNPTQLDASPTLPATESGLPPSGTILDIDQSKEILKRLASGELKVPR